MKPARRFHIAVSTERRIELSNLAVLAAIEAPERQGSLASRATISWETIHEIRALLDDVGFDWRAAVMRRKAIQDENKAKARELRLAKGRGE